MAVSEERLAVVRAYAGRLDAIVRRLPYAVSYGHWVVGEQAVFMWSIPITGYIPLEQSNMLFDAAAKCGASKSRLYRDWHDPVYATDDSEQIPYYQFIVAYQC